MWLWARAELRRRWVALVVLGVLVGITAGVAMASVAGARRTATGWDRLREATRASDAIVFASQAGIYTDAELQYDRLAELPYVTGVGGFGLFWGTSSLGDVGGFMTTYGDWLDGVDTPRIVEGRGFDPDDPNEIVLSLPEEGGELARSGLEVGDTLDIHLYTQGSREQQTDSGQATGPDGPSITAEVVGVADSPFNLAAIPDDGGLFVGPAFLERYGPISPASATPWCASPTPSATCPVSRPRWPACTRVGAYLCTTWARPASGSPTALISNAVAWRCSGRRWRWPGW